MRISDWSSDVCSSDRDGALAVRWLGHFPRGRFTHANIAAAAPVRGERLLGWWFHYATGIAFASALLVANGVAWARQPTLLPCLGLGLLTVLFPYFVMQPPLGAGIAGSKTPTRSEKRRVGKECVTVYISVVAVSLKQQHNSKYNVQKDN